jgi:uncharacterized membrane protein
MKKFNAKTLSRLGIIAGLYVALSVLVLPLASGAIQIRFGEAMTLLPLFFPEATISLFIGCAIVNLISGCALTEIIAGSLITLIAGVLTAITGKVIKNKVLKIFVGGLFPVLLNALLLPVVWVYCYGALEYMYFLQVLFLFVGQTVAVYLLGTPVILFVKKQKDKGIRFLN